MNKSSATIMAAALMLASSCTEVKQEGQGYEPIIGKQEITIKDGRLTPEALWAMGRIGSLSISPDGKKIAYTVASQRLLPARGSPARTGLLHPPAENFPAQTDRPHRTAPVQLPEKKLLCGSDLWY